MIAEKKLMYDKETGVYQKVIGAKYHYPPRPKNPLVYDKETGVYQKEERQTKRAKVERQSGEFLDVSEVYIQLERTYATSMMSSSPVPFERTYATSMMSSSPVPFERTYATSMMSSSPVPLERTYATSMMSSSTVPLERTYATSIINVPLRSFKSNYIKNFKPSSSVRYIGGCQSDYIKNFKIPN